MSNGTRTDIKLLLACLRTCDPQERQVALRSIIHAGVDWDKFTTLVAQHEVAPTVYKALRNAGIPEIPASCLSDLRTQFHQAGLESYRLFEALLTILNLLQTHQIEAVPYKGPVLSAMIYGDLAMRTSQDIDILVKPVAVPRVRELLQQHGYQWIERDSDPSQDHHDQFINDKTGVLVEIHWDVVSLKHGFTLSTAEFWKRLKPVEVNGKSILTFAPEDLLLLLCVHGTKHYWRSIKWILDVGNLINQCAIDWPWVLHEARRLRIERQLVLGLLLAQQLLNSQLPPSLTGYMRRPSMMRGLAWFHVRQLAGRSELYPYIEGSIVESIVHRSPQSGWRLIQHFIQRRLSPNEQDRAVFKLPGPICIVYWLIRPVRLLLIYGLSPFRRTETQPAPYHKRID